MTEIVTVDLANRSYPIHTHLSVSYSANIRSP